MHSNGKLGPLGLWLLHIVLNWKFFYINICCFIIFIWTATKNNAHRTVVQAEIAQFNDASFGDENCKSGHVTVSHAHFEGQILFVA